MIWIIGISGSHMDNVFTYRVEGNEEQVRKHLFELVEEDRESETYSTWERGTESIDDVVPIGDNRLYAFGRWDDYHNDYTATPQEEIMILED